VERKQINLLFKVLKLLSEKELLDKMLIVGSWSIYFYKYYFKKKRNIIASLRTRDIDFFIPHPESIKEKVNIPQLLRKFGFIVELIGEKGYLRLSHPYFFIEFLVSEKGIGLDKPYNIFKIGVNAQPLRFLDILFMKTVTIKFKGISLLLPHPACFLLHKIIIFKRRPQLSKRKKEILQIKRLWKFLEKEKEKYVLTDIFLKLIPKWQKRIIRNLKELQEESLTALLQYKI